MTISNDAVRKAGPFVGNSIATVFAFAFKTISAADLSVTLLTTATGVQQLLVLNTDYTVALNADQSANPGGTVTTIGAISPIPNTKTLTISGNAMSDTQGTHLITPGPWNPADVEQMVDRAMIAAQQLRDRTIKFPVIDAVAPVDLPSAENRAGKFLGFDAVGAIVLAAQVGMALTSTVIGQVAFGAAGNTLAQDANLFWDNTNKRLGIGNAAPTQTLDVTGTGKFSTSVVTTSVLSGGVANINVGGGGGNWVFDGASGSLYPGSGLSGLVDIGKASTNLVRSGFFGTSVVTPLVESPDAGLSTPDLTMQVGVELGWAFSINPTNAFFPVSGDAISDLGRTAKRFRTTFTAAVDSGASSLILQPNATPTLKIVAVGSTNFTNVQGAATTFAPVIFANGSDTNISMIFSSKGTGSLDFATEGTFSGDINSNRVIQFRVLDTNGANRILTATGAVGPANPILGATAGGVAIVGTPTNDNAASGQYGEYSSVTVGSGSAVALTTVTPANVTSITLGAGDWDVTGTIAWQFGVTTSYTNLLADWSTTTGTLSGIVGQRFDYETPATVPTAGSDMQFTMPTTRFSLSGSTTIFLVAQGTFTVSTLKAYGFIRARRVR